MTPSNIATRFSELASVAAVEQHARALHDMCTDPSGKRYTRQRDLRRRVWLDVLSHAERQVHALADGKVETVTDIPSSAVG